MAMFFVAKNLPITLNIIGLLFEHDIEFFNYSPIN